MPLRHVISVASQVGTGFVELVVKLEVEGRERFAG
jgi:hypothetical protein